MNREDLYRQSGFTNRAIQETLTSVYYPYLFEVLHTLVENPEAVPLHLIIEQMMRRLPEFDIACDLQHLAYDCLRKQITELLREQKIHPKAGRRLLVVYQQQLQTGSVGPFLIEELDRILSFCKRKDFEYFLGRYYYFDDSVPYNERSERAIANLFQLKGDVRELAAWTEMHMHSTSAGNYMLALDHLSMHFIAQIPGKGALVAHSDALQYGGSQIRQHAHRKAFPWMLLIFLLVMLILLWKCISG